MYRTKMALLREKMSTYTKSDMILNQNQLKEIIDMMNDLSTINCPVFKSDED